ncbi:hypothetical protein ACIPRD_08935 [Streptomyces sp. NPDC090108]|uniref:hypothetical protein n=1 Tax=Streptomyces sp. NPDC090108 TaxID=3365947 RepID=UPI003825DDF1
MAGSAHATVAGPGSTPTRDDATAPARARGLMPLATVAAVFTVAQLLLVPPVMGLGWDETVYVSQVSAHAPAAFFSAPRARGVSLLTAPIAAWSSSTPLLRVFLAVLSGLALFLALRAWRGLFPVRVLAVAGALFASLWVTLFYGPQVMPNYWVAVGALAAVGCFLRAGAGASADFGAGAEAGVDAGAGAGAGAGVAERAGAGVGAGAVDGVGAGASAGAGAGVRAGASGGAVDRRPPRGARRSGERRAALAGLAASAALMALMRPMDAVWACLPLLALGLRSRYRRSLLVLLAGLAAGAAEWVIEAYLGYGGLLRRLSDGSAIQGGLGLHLAVVDQLRSLGGRALCRPCTGALPGPAVVLWWFALPVLAALGLGAAVRTRRTMPVLAPLACAVTAAVPYLFLIGYAAPRFLLPAYALLAIPAACALDRTATARDGSRRPLAVALAGLVLVAHLTVQLTVLMPLVDRTTVARQAWAGTADTLHGLGVSPPCLLTGHEAIPVAFYTGCSSADTTGHNANSTVGAISRTARSRPVATLVAPGTLPPAYTRDWPFVPYGGLRLYYAVPEAGR